MCHPAVQVLHTELTHISGQRVVQGDLTDISNLVEILAALTFVATPLDAAGECGLVRQSTQMLLALEVAITALHRSARGSWQHSLPDVKGSWCYSTSFICTFIFSAASLSARLLCPVCGHTGQCPHHGTVWVSLGHVAHQM